MALLNEGLRVLYHLTQLLLQCFHTLPECLVPFCQLALELLHLLL